MRRVVVADARSDGPHPFHDGMKIGFGWRGRANPEPMGVASGGDCGCRSDQGFRRHATAVEAVAPHELALDEGDLCPESSGTGRGNESGGSGADDDQVVAVCGNRVLPARWVDIAEKFLVVGIAGKESGNRGVQVFGVHGVSISSMSVVSRRVFRARRVTRMTTAAVAAMPTIRRPHSSGEGSKSPAPTAVSTPVAATEPRLT